jgi:hypothetical protein
MFGNLSVRFAGTMGIVSLALATAALVTFPAFPTTGANLRTVEPVVTVNRTLKGDRIPVLQPSVLRVLRTPTTLQPQAQIPAGCDRAFSPISSPRLAHVFRRCIT